MRNYDKPGGVRVNEPSFTRISDQEKGWRKNTAQASGGTSDNHIYIMFTRALQAYHAGGKMLDFGSGKGVLSRRLIDMRLFEAVVAVDISTQPERLDPLVDWHSRDLNEPTNFDSESFDVIVSSEVIEHLENPRFVVREWLRILKPGGLVFFSTPNNESLRSILALAFRGHFAAFGDLSYPAHITPLLRKDIERILNEAGFHPPHFIYSDYGTIPKLKRITWQHISFGILRGLRFSDNILTVTRKPVPPNSSDEKNSVHR